MQVLQIESNVVRGESIHTELVQRSISEEICYDLCVPRMGTVAIGIWGVTFVQQDSCFFNTNN